MARGPQIADVVAADARRLTGGQADVADVLEGGGGSYADEQRGDSGVDDVPAIPAAVPVDERSERPRHGLARGGPPHARAAPELLDDYREHERGCTEHQQRQRLAPDPRHE